MSKTQLQTNNAKLEALITELQGKAAGGGGGAGGSIETCTVTIIYTGGGSHWTPEGALTTVTDNGSLQSTLVSEGDITKGGVTGTYDVQSVINNVAVGTSVMFVDTEETYSEPIIELQGAELVSAAYTTFYAKILDDATITVRS